MFSAPASEAAGGHHPWFPQSSWSLSRTQGSDPKLLGVRGTLLYGTDGLAVAGSLAHVQRNQIVVRYITAGNFHRHPVVVAKPNFRQAEPVVTNDRHVNLVVAEDKRVVRNH